MSLVHCKCNLNLRVVSFQGVSLVNCQCNHCCLNLRVSGIQETPVKQYYYFVIFQVVRFQTTLEDFYCFLKCTATNSEFHHYGGHARTAIRNPVIPDSVVSPEIVAVVAHGILPIDPWLAKATEDLLTDVRMKS